MDLTEKLNPVVKQLNEITDYSSTTAKNTREKAEYPHLKRVIRNLNKDIQFALEQLTNLQIEIEKAIYTIENTTGDDKSDAISYHNKLFKILLRRIKSSNRLLQTISEPYFGKVVFDRKQVGQFKATTINSYIGKKAYFDDKTKDLLITDWRAPIARLYYEHNGPAENVQVKSPRGIQKGDLINRLQFEILYGKFKSIYESKSGNRDADEFLLHQLESRRGKKLEDIIASIQEQQHQIIRDSIDHPVIIQGVAGSGKTTILLHKIAYMMYTYKDEIDVKETLVMAPNKIFLDYISDVLPTLGVEGMGQSTYILWAKNILGWNERFLLSSEKPDLKIKKFKGSRKFIQIIDQFIEEFEEDLFDKMPGNERLVTAVKKRFFEMKEKFPGVHLSERLSLSVDYVFSQIQFGNGIAYGLSTVRLKSQQNTIQRYAKKRMRLLPLYKQLLSQTHLFKNAGLESNLIKRINSRTKNILKKKAKITYYEIEDLAPLLYLFFVLDGYKDFLLDYIVVDEAQDMSVFQLYTLFRCARRGNITLAGDLGQAIYLPFYISDWNEVIEIIDEEIDKNSTDGDNKMDDKDNIRVDNNDYSVAKLEAAKVRESQKTKYYQLTKCYRTTIEIIEYANKVLAKRFPEQYTLPEAVLRHGDPVKEIKTEQLVDTIKSESKKNSSTIAVLCRDIKHANKVFEFIQQSSDKLGLQIFTYEVEDFQEGVFVIPITYAKGLEFDAVVLMDMDNYDDDLLSSRLLYVGMTRALHRLFVIK